MKNIQYSYDKLLEEKEKERKLGEWKQADWDRSSELRNIAMDPNKSKYMSPREKINALSFTDSPKKYGNVQYL